MEGILNLLMILLAVTFVPFVWVAIQAVKISFARIAQVDKQVEIAIKTQTEMDTASRKENRTPSVLTDLDKVLLKSNLAQGAPNHPNPFHRYFNGISAMVLATGGSEKDATKVFEETVVAVRYAPLLDERSFYKLASETWQAMKSQSPIQKIRVRAVAE